MYLSPYRISLLYGDGVFKMIKLIPYLEIDFISSIVTTFFIQSVGGFVNLLSTESLWILYVYMLVSFGKRPSFIDVIIDLLRASLKTACLSV